MSDLSLHNVPVGLPHSVATILPCNDIAASAAFYARLGLAVVRDYGRYKLLSDGKGWQVHLSAEAPAGWVVLGRNPNSPYLNVADVEGLSARVRDLIIGAVDPSTSRGACMSSHSPIPMRRWFASAGRAA